MSDRLALGSAGVVADDHGNVSCTGPRACYDESKRFGETLSVTFASRYRLPVVVLRPFDNYGPGLRVGDRRDSVVPLDDGLRRSLIWYSENGS